MSVLKSILGELVSVDKIIVHSACHVSALTPACNCQLVQCIDGTLDLIFSSEDRGIAINCDNVTDLFYLMPAMLYFAHSLNTICNSGNWFNYTAKEIKRMVTEQ